MAEAWQSAWVEVLPDFSGFKKKADSELTGTLGAAGTSGGLLAGKNLQGGIVGGIKSIGAPVFAAIAALGIGKLVGDAIGQGIRYSIDAVGIASDLSETKAAIGVVFGDASADILAFAETANKSLGSTRQAALSGAQTFGIFAKAAGLTGKPLAKFSTDLVGLAGDMASFYNADPTQVIEDLGAGLRGEAEPLRKYGVLLDDAVLRAQALKLGIYDGNGALTGQQKILAAQAEIFSQTSLAQGDFARTSDGLANQQRILAASLEDTQAKLGEALLPAFTDLTNYANENLVPALAGFIDHVGPILGEALTEAQPGLEELAGKLSPLVDAFVKAAGKEGIPAFVTAMNDAVDAAPEWIQALDDINSGFGDFETGFYDAQQSVSDYFAPARQAVIDFSGSLEEFFSDTETNGNDFRESLRIAGQDVKQFAFDAQLSLGNFLVGVGTSFAGAKSEVTRFGVDILLTIGNMANQTFAAGQNVINGLVMGIASKGSEVANTLKNIANVAIDQFKNTLGIKSPSRVFAQLGAYTAEGFVMGINGSQGIVSAAIGSMVAIPDVASSSTASAITAGSITTSAATAQSGFPSQVTLVDASGALLGQMDVRVGRADQSNSLTALMGKRV